MNISEHSYVHSIRLCATNLCRSVIAYLHTVCVFITACSWLHFYYIDFDNSSYVAVLFTEAAGNIK